MISVHRAGDRFRTQLDWLDEQHSFSFGDFYDPANTHHGVLMANNDETVRAGTGFDTHPHRDMEIVTWVVRGSLVHQDSRGHAGIVYPGLAQRMSAGAGIMHSEKNDSAVAARTDEPVRFIQMYVVPDAANTEPSYEQREIADELLTGGLVTVASGMAPDDAAIRINNRSARLQVARLLPGQSVQVPTARYLHLFVALGTATLEGTGTLAEGDAVRMTDSGGQRLHSTSGAEILIWEMQRALGE